MPDAAAASRALPMSRDAMATGVASRLSCIAGMTRLSAMFAAPRIPQRTGVVELTVCRLTRDGLLAVQRKSESRRVGVEAAHKLCGQPPLREGSPHPRPLLGPKRGHRVGAPGAACGCER